VPSGGSEQGFGGGEIVYMTSSSPMGPFSYKGRVLKNPSAYFGVGGNNHHCMFSFQGKWYITYHAATVDQAMGWNAGYRSTFVDELRLDGEGLPALSQGTLAGPAQLCPLNPFQEVNGAVLASLAGAETQLIREEDQKAGAGEMAAVSTAAKGWRRRSGRFPALRRAFRGQGGNSAGQLGQRAPGRRFPAARGGSRRVHRGAG